MNGAEIENSKAPAAGRDIIMNSTELKNQVKQIMVADLMLKVGWEEIADDLQLFGPGGLGLDSIDALQLVVALDKNFGLKITDTQAAKNTLQNVNSIVAAIEQSRH
jgi:acyl carrier protein